MQVNTSALIQLFPHHNYQLQTVDVNVVTCHCSAPDGVKDMTGDERITVQCILHGYQSQRYRETV